MIQATTCTMTLFRIFVASSRVLHNNVDTFHDDDDLFTTLWLHFSTSPFKFEKLFFSGLLLELHGTFVCAATLCPSLSCVSIT